MRSWRTRQLRAAVASSVEGLAPRVLGLVVAVSLSAASFAFAAVKLHAGSARAAVTPTIATTASPPTRVGFTIFDNANLTNGDNPTGTITFRLFGPGDVTCSAPPVFTDPVTVAGNGSYNSMPYTTTQAGVYRWTASYDGDANNSPVAAPCNAPNESVVVTKAEAVLRTTASGPVAIGGGPISDTAHLRAGFNPTGTITFELFGPPDTFCSTPPVFVSQPVTVNGNGDYSSGNYTPTQPGLYKWRAVYSGDENNNPDGPTPCLDPDEDVMVTGGQIIPLLGTVASGTVEVGGQISDTATLANGAGPTGTITFNLYGPDDATCAGPVADTSTATVTGNGQYTSAPFTTTAPGTYRYVATYSGDATHSPVFGVCNAPGESVVVTSGSSTTTSSSSTSVPTTSSTTPTSSSTSSSSTTPTSSSTTIVPTSSSTTSSSTTSSSTTVPPASTTTTSPSPTTTTIAPTGSSTTLPQGSTTSTINPPVTLPPSTTPTTRPTTTTTTVPPVPSGTTTVPPAQPTVGVTPQTQAAGQDVTVFGSGFPPRSPLDVVLFSDPVLLTTTVSDAAGSFRVVVTIPVGTPPGAHRIVVSVRGGSVQAETVLTVTSPAPLRSAASPATATTPAGRLSRTGSGQTLPVQVAGALMVIGLLLVVGACPDSLRRLPGRRGGSFHRRPTE